MYELTDEEFTRELDAFYGPYEAVQSSEAGEYVSRGAPHHTLIHARADNGSRGAAGKELADEEEEEEVVLVRMWEVSSEEGVVLVRTWEESSEKGLGIGRSG